MTTSPPRSADRWLGGECSCLVAGVLIVGMVGCGGGGGSEAPKREVIDERNGTYRGVALGTSTREDIVRRLGEPDEEGGTLIGPIGGDGNTAAGYAGCRGRRQQNLRYQEVGFWIGGGVVCLWSTIEEGAATTRGVAIGDPLSAAEEAHSRLDCGVRGRFSEYPVVPYCTGKLGPRRFIWFGGDPIETIEMNTSRLDL